MFTSLQQQTRTEELTGANQYRCSGCEQKVDALRSLRYSRLPHVLTIALNRFSCVGVCVVWV